MEIDKNIQSALTATMLDLNLTYDSENMLDEGLLDYLKGAGQGVVRTAANAGRTVGIGVTNTTNKIGSAVGTPRRTSSAPGPARYVPGRSVGHSGRRSAPAFLR